MEEYKVFIQLGQLSSSCDAQNQTPLSPGFFLLSKIADTAQHLVADLLFRYKVCGHVDGPILWPN